MKKRLNSIILMLFSFLFIPIQSCQDNIKDNFNTDNYDSGKSIEIAKIIPAAERTAFYYPRLQDKRIGLVVNQTSLVGEVHLVDTLVSLGLKIEKIFTPEHGFRGTADAGEKINDSSVGKNEIPIISLYGDLRKPGPEQLQNLDVMVFDLQDVGVRFYTYISTLHYVMEACAENNVSLLVLDRPNPNGFYVDGPVLDPSFSSFVGMHPVPVVHGLTIGEYARMINGEGWLQSGVQCQLEVITCLNYDHNMTYSIPVKPSPNLPNLRSVLLYPSLCLFEPTYFSIGRGTEKQFQLIGHPKLTDMDFAFTPISREGATKPKHMDVNCYGEDLTQLDISELTRATTINFDWLFKYYNLCMEKDLEFFSSTGFFDKLAGSDQLRIQMEKGWSLEEIRETWQEKLELFKEKRKGYLLYPDIKT